MPSKQRAKSQPNAVADDDSDDSDEVTETTTTTEAKPKKLYFCEGTGAPIDHKARFGGMGFDAQLKSRLVNAALKGETGTRFDNATGEAITGPAAELLADLGWSKFLVQAQESRGAKAEKKAAKAAAKLASEADKAEGTDADDDADENNDEDDE